ncbi:hypothetical protein MIS45_09725 [Wielerella bovis]|uniref:hypothetical protein n=1 Tax=Wielerella bovis TaxID=2917790 RepID=UPI0020183EDB|nr:hypothetical protein [Wielerella bovis]ULJ69021.1 hypothetical protein MIS45_09725 [Wielerella bovis]
METGKPKPGMEMIGGGGSSGGGSSGGGSSGAKTQTVVGQAIQKSTEGLNTDLYVVSGILILITVIIVGVAAVIKMMREAEMGELRIDMTDEQFADEMFSYQDGEEHSHFTDEFVQDFFDETNEHTASTFASEMFTDEPPDDPIDQFVTDMFTETDTTESELESQDEKG